jgi:hypothetical protein
MKAKKGNTITESRLRILGRHEPTIVPMLIILVELCGDEKMFGES